MIERCFIVFSCVVKFEDMCSDWQRAQRCFLLLSIGLLVLTFIIKQLTYTLRGIKLAKCCQLSSLRWDAELILHPI
jgi:hypothetical protein